MRTRSLICWRVDAIGIGSFITQLVVSFRNKEALADFTGDPWGGRTLEWSTSSPPPAYNFAVEPTVRSRRPLWDLKHPEDQDENYE